ncbi:hypothetical protein D3C71_1674360 [compost metagenome]
MLTGTLVDQRRDGGRHADQFVNADAPSVAVLALRAARGFEQGVRRGRVEPQALTGRRIGEVRNLAMRTQGAQQALGQNAHQRGRQQVGIDAHVDQPRDGAHRTVGMQGR